MDLEVQLAVVTTCRQLQKQLHKEQAALFTTSSIVSPEVLAAPDRFVPYWVRAVIRTMKHFF
jgi:hypothetical protein